MNERLWVDGQWVDVGTAQAARYNNVMPTYGIGYGSDSSKSWLPGDDSDIHAWGVQQRYLPWGPGYAIDTKSPHMQTAQELSPTITKGRPVFNPQPTEYPPGPGQAGLAEALLHAMGGLNRSSGAPSSPFSAPLGATMREVPATLPLFPGYDNSLKGQALADLVRSLGGPWGGGAPASSARASDPLTRALLGMP